VVSWTVDGHVQQDVHTERYADAAVPGPGDRHQQVPGAEPEGQLPDAGSHQAVVGDIPAEPPGYRRRADLLAQLDRAGEPVSVIHPVTGLHGVGATQLAAAYAREKLAAGWRLVAWVNGADASSLLAGLSAVADVTGLADGAAGRGIADPGAAVRHGLEADGDRCLLVFDGVPDPDVLRPYVPASGAARVLITSARPRAASIGRGVPVDAFSAEEASAFLAARTGLDDRAGAAAVAATLGQLPLALSLAGPLIAEGRLGYLSYLDRLQATSDDAYLAGDDERPYPPFVAQAVLASLQAVREADRTGVCSRLMEFIAVLSAAGVRRELLYAAGQAGVLSSGGRRITADQLDMVLEWLADRSLLTVSVDGQAVIVHRLVAQVIGDGLARRQAFTAACEAAAFVLDVYSQALVGSPDREAIRGIPQQVTALVDYLAGPATEAETDDELAWVLLRLRFVAFYHLIELGDSTPQAVALGEPLAADLESLLGADHPDTLNSRNSLAAAYLAAGRVAEAVSLFEQTLAMRQRMLGPEDPETLNSQNNLASAYQDAGRIADAIRLNQANLELRERLLGPDHPSTLNSRGNLAAAYRADGRGAEAIPLLEQTLAGRERILGAQHVDTEAARRNLAAAYRADGRFAEAIPLEQALAGRERILGIRLDAQAAPKNLAADPPGGRAATIIPPAEQAPAGGKHRPPDGAAGQTGFRRPPIGPAARALPAGFRRPPADHARQPRHGGAPGPAARLTDHSASRPRQQANDVSRDREVAAAIAAGDPAGIAMAYDRYATALYGYCHWMLRRSADAAEAVTDTFVVAAATLRDRPEPAQLRPWLFSLARNECRRRIRPASASDTEEEADSAGQQSATAAEASDAPITFRAGRPPGGARQSPDETITFRAIGQPPKPARQSSDETVTFRAIGHPPVAVRESSDETVTFRAIGHPPKPARQSPDETVTFRAIGHPPKPARQSPDETVTFRAIGHPPKPARESSDETVTFRAIGRQRDTAFEGPEAATQFHLLVQPSDTMMAFRVVSESAQANGNQGQAELRSLIHSILAGLKPREREVIELTFRHHLGEDDLAIALDVSPSRARALATQARDRLEEDLRALHIALTGREACPELGELLANWDGQLTEDKRDLVVWHIGECQTCARHGWGALRPAAFSRLLPLDPLPPELRAQVLSACGSTAADAVAHRRRVARRAERVWLARLSMAFRHVSWAGIRANPGIAIATATLALWITAALVSTLLLFAGPHAAHAQAPRPTGSPAATASATQAGAGTSARIPAPAPTTAPATSAAPSPSPTFTQPAYVPPPVQPTPTLAASPSPAGSPSPSRSPSPSASPSRSPSPSTSPSRSPSPSPSSSKSPKARG
jgi:RNA polymerase sigma factor (sigma-70 family)